MIKSYVKKIKRLQKPRMHNQAGLRCDYAERLINFNDTFFTKFLESLTQEDFITYPSYQDYESLKIKIANSLEGNFKKENIMLSTGSDSCIKSLIQSTCGVGDDVISTTPCFPMYFIHSEAVGSNFISINPKGDQYLSIERIKKSITKKTKLVFLTNPNSPFGDVKSCEEIEVLCKHLNLHNIVLLIDEAYVDFSNGNCLSLLAKYNNVVISRTFSKAWGAAGCRIGYLIGNKQIISEISNVELTYPISGPALRFVNYLLDNKNEIDAYIKRTIFEREKLCDILEEKYDVIRSNTNTIHIHEKNGDNQKTIVILDKHNVGFKSGNRKTATKVIVPNDTRETWVRLSVGAGIIKSDFIKEILECDNI